MVIFKKIFKGKDGMGQSTGDPVNVVQELKLPEFRRQPVLLDLAGFDRRVVRPAPGISDKLALRIPDWNADTGEVAAIGEALPLIAHQVGLGFDLLLEHAFDFIHREIGDHRGPGIAGGRAS